MISNTQQAVLFDLDGTLLDTAPDLSDALNKLLLEEGLKAVNHDHIRPIVSHGGRALVEFGFKLKENHPRFETLRSRFLNYYAQSISNKTELFPGMERVITHLETNQILWGVVTNKPAWLTDPLMQQMKLYHRAACVVSGDTTPFRKPHPAPLYYACDQMGIPAEQCLYVGDHERDITAGRSAGMKTLVALFGYIGHDVDPKQWRADGYIDQPMDILDWLKHDDS